METLNRNHISYQEMDELIRLAEKVSVNIEELKRKIKIRYAYILLYFSFALLIVLLMISGTFGQVLNSIFSNVVSEIMLKTTGGIIVGVFLWTVFTKTSRINKNEFNYL